MKIKKAFTLAEVLTTLMVIGVVAALTIPNLMNSYKERETVTKLRKAYAELSLAVKTIPVTVDCTVNDFECANWANLSGEEKLSLYLKQYKNSKEIEVDDAHKEVSDINVGFITGNGTGIYLSIPNYTTSDYALIDINGPKGPNRTGIDIFGFFIVYEKTNTIEAGTVIPWGSKQEDEVWGEDSNSYWRDNPLYCHEHSNYWGCAGQVLEEGKINYKVK